MSQGQPIASWPQAPLGLLWTASKEQTGGKSSISIQDIPETFYSVVMSLEVQVEAGSKWVFTDLNLAKQKDWSDAASFRPSP